MPDTEAMASRERLMKSAAVVKCGLASPVAVVGSLVLKADPSFDARNFGFKKLGELVKVPPYLEVKLVPSVEGSQIIHLSVRGKET